MLVDESAPFQIDEFITALHPIRNHFHINFSIGYMLREGTDVRYFYPSINNSCLLPTAFRVNEERDIDKFKTKFEKGSWLYIDIQRNLRPNTKSVGECLCQITFYVSIIKGFFQHVDIAPTTLPDFFKLNGFRVWS